MTAETPEQKAKRLEAEQVPVTALDAVCLLISAAVGVCYLVFNHWTTRSTTFFNCLLIL